MPGGTGFLRADAENDFLRARRRQVVARLAHRLRREPDGANRLLPLDEVVGVLGRRGERRLGLRTIRLDCRGGRPGDDRCVRDRGAHRRAGRGTGSPAAVARSASLRERTSSEARNAASTARRSGSACPGRQRVVPAGQQGADSGDQGDGLVEQHMVTGCRDLDHGGEAAKPVVHDLTQLR